MRMWRKEIVRKELLKSMGAKEPDEKIRDPA